MHGYAVICIVLPVVINQELKDSWGNPSSGSDLKMYLGIVHLLRDVTGWNLKVMTSVTG